MIPNILIILAHPAFVGISATLMFKVIFDFWTSIVDTRSFYRPAFKPAFSILNGVVIFLLAQFTTCITSPAVIGIVTPLALIIEVFIICRPGRWGVLVLFFLSSFQYITLYSISIGIVNLWLKNSKLATGPHVASISLLNLLLFLVMLTLKLYQIKVKGIRNEQVNKIIKSPKHSSVLFIFSTANAIAITILTFDSLNSLQYFHGPQIIDIICRNMILRDTIMFFCTILILDVQTRMTDIEEASTQAIAKNVILERDLQTQAFIQQGLEAAKKKLEKQNQELEDGLEYEQQLRKKLHRNVLLRVTVNVTKSQIVDSGALNISDDNGAENTDYLKMLGIFLSVIVHPDNQAELNNLMQPDKLTAMIDNEKGFNIPFRLSTKGFMDHVALDDEAARIYVYMDRDYIWTSIDCIVTRTNDGEIYAYLYIMDVDEQKQKEENFKKAATTDALTGLLNRRAFEQELNDYMSGQNNGGALFMFDLDYFKSVNDNLGHPMGDELLKRVAEILHGTFRSDDLICRIGGDEFCAFAKGFTNREYITQRAELLNEKGRITYEAPNGTPINVSFSIGISITPGDADSAPELYKCADTALYSAKEAGRDCYKTYS